MSGQLPILGGGGGRGFNNNNLNIQQDAVEVVVKNLKKNANSTTFDCIDETLVRKTQEQLRLLKIQLGGRGKLNPLDREQVRAVILLDYVCRETKGTRLDYKELMKAVNIGYPKNKTKFIQLVEMIGNFRQTTSNVSRADVSGRGGGGGGGGNHQRAIITNNKNSRSQHQSLTKNQNNATTIVSTNVEKEGDEQGTSSTIPRLAIRLSSLILDPNGVANQAKTLFVDIQEFVQTLAMPRRSDQLMDIQRCNSEYEAACLFYVVSQTQTKKLQSQQSTTTKTGRKKNQQPSKPSSKHQQDKNSTIMMTAQGGENNEEQQQQHTLNLNRLLEMDDILEACPQFSDRDFKQVCKHVETLVKEMLEQQHAKKTTRGQRNKKTGGRQQKKKNTTTTATNNKRGKKRTAAANDDDDDLDDNITNNAKETNDSRNTNKKQGARQADKKRKKKASTIDDELDVPSLQEWKKQVLDDACQAAKKELLATQKGMTLEAVDATREVLLASAADEVLRKFGLL